MKKLSSQTLLIFLILFSGILKAQDHSMTSHILLNKNKLVWKDGPPSLPKGAKIAILEGDMSKEGPFSVRLSLPANYKISPHWHPAIEHVTVVQGDFYMGAGENFNKGGATKLSAGGFAVMPIKYAHFAFTKGETIIQLHGIGPWGITYINEADDPRKK